MPNLNETQRKIEGFKNINPGWHFGEGVPPENNAIIAAKTINDAFNEAGFSETNAFLGAGGQIQVNGYRDDCYLELIYESGTISFELEEEGLVVVDEEDLSLSEAISRINYWGKKWLMSEFSTKITSIPNLEYSQLSQFSAQVQLVSQYLTKTVPSQQPSVFVNISGSTIRGLQESRQFTSASPKISYRGIGSSTQLPVLPMITAMGIS